MRLALLLALALPAGAQTAQPDLRQARDSATLLLQGRIPDRFGPDADNGSFKHEGGAALPNFGKVNDKVFRSAQPSAEGLKQAAALGVKTVLTLRMGVDDEERDAAKALGLSVANVRMNGILAPSFSQVDRALKVIQAGPVLVHCRHGKDRTGLVLGAYRVAVEGWDIEKAAREAESYGCCHQFFPDPREYLKDYMEHRSGRRVIPLFPTEDDPEQGDIE